MKRGFKGESCWFRLLSYICCLALCFFLLVKSFRVLSTSLIRKRGLYLQRLWCSASRLLIFTIVGKTLADSLVPHAHLWTWEPISSHLIFVRGSHMYELCKLMSIYRGCSELIFFCNFKFMHPVLSLVFAWQCLKFKTDQAQDAKKMEKLNNIFFALMARGPEGIRYFLPLIF